MNVVAIILVILHFVGVALLLGGFLYQIRDIVTGQGRVLRLMLDGVWTQLVTGVALVGIYSAGLVDGEEVNNTKVAVKLGVLIVIAVLALIFRKRVPAPSWALWLIGALTLANVVIAVAWE